MQSYFTDKVVIVTGSAFGIGRATALAFAKRGAKVVLADMIADQTTENAIKDDGGEAIFVLCDVTKELDIKNLVSKTISTYGRLDFAFNNAGVEGAPAMVNTCTNESWDKTMNVNLRGVWWCMKYQIPEI